MVLKQLVLAAFTALSQPSQAAQTNDVSSQPLSKHFLLVDQGNNFDGMSRDFRINRLIQDLDDKMQQVIAPIFENGTEMESDAIYYGYGDRMDNIAGDFYAYAELFGVSENPIDLCTSTNFHRFVGQHLEEVKNFYEANPDLKADGIIQTIKEIEQGISELENLNIAKAAEIQMNTGDQSVTYAPCGLDHA